jgi:hypothetical protein
MIEECNSLTPIEKYCIDAYTATAYHYVNRFLQDRDTIDIYKSFNSSILAKYLYFILKRSNINNSNNINSNTLTLFKKEINIQLDNDNVEWFRFLMYKYTFLLYNAIYKCPKGNIPFTVYRGTISHYLREDPNKYFYLNTFTSTSSDFRTANSFSKARNKSSGIIYNFIVRSNTSFIHIEDIEDEILINPYQLYRYIRKEGNIYYYYIIPSTINIPNEYNQFMEFKSEILDKSETISGGKMETYTIQKETRKHNKVKHNKTRKNLEIRRERERLARERFRERMNMPIGTSSKYVLPTKEMEEEFNQIKKMFNLDY